MKTDILAVRLDNSIHKLDPRRCDRCLSQFRMVDSGVHARLHHRRLCDRCYELRRYISCGDSGLPSSRSRVHHILRELDNLLQ